MAVLRLHLFAIRVLLATGLAVLAFAAHAADAPARDDDDAVANTLVPPAPETVLAVPPELQRMLQAKVIDASRSRVERAQLLTNFLFGADGLHMLYQANASHDVAESFATRKADCLGLSLLTVALARAAGLHAHGQELQRVMARDLDGDIAVQITHANAAISASGRHYVIDVAADELIDPPPPHAVDDAHLLAMFYDNRAMELMLQGKLDAANVWLQAALREDARYANLWSNAAVLAARNGNYADAERDLQHALHRDPFHQYVLGRANERDGNYAEAERHYQLAIHFDHDVHQFHFALARIYFNEGQTRRAGAELARASMLSNGNANDAYQAKLDKLRQMLR